MVDWLGLTVPIAYLSLLIGSLATCSSLYRKRKAGISPFSLPFLSNPPFYNPTPLEPPLLIPSHSKIPLPRTLVPAPPPPRHLPLPPPPRTFLLQRRENPRRTRQRAQSRFAPAGRRRYQPHHADPEPKTGIGESAGEGECRGRAVAAV